MRTDPLPLDPLLAQTLSRISTATLTTVLLKKGLRNVRMRSTVPLAHFSNINRGRHEQA